MPSLTLPRLNLWFLLCPTGASSSFRPYSQPPSSSQGCWTSMADSKKHHHLLVILGASQTAQLDARTKDREFKHRNPRPVFSIQHNPGPERQRAGMQLPAALAPSTLSLSSLP